MLVGGFRGGVWGGAHPFRGLEEGAHERAPLERWVAGYSLQEPVETGGTLIKIRSVIKSIVANSSRLRSINSGLNLSPVIYSVASRSGYPSTLSRQQTHPVGVCPAKQEPHTQGNRAQDSLSEIQSPGSAFETTGLGWRI